MMHGQKNIKYLVMLEIKHGIFGTTQENGWICVLALQTG